MSKAWMPMYWGDYRANTAHLTTAEHGAYMLLIAHYWEHEGLPTDDKKLRRITGLTAAAWNRSRNTLADFFDPGWRHTKIDDLLSHQKRLSTENSHKAKLRWENKGTADAAALPGQCKSQSQSESQSKKKDSEPNGSAPPDDPRTELFGQGLTVLSRLTGKPPNSCRSLIGRWLKLVDDEAIHVLAAILDAAENRVADPVGWIFGALRSKQRRTGDVRTDREIGKQKWRDALAQLRRFGEGTAAQSDSGGAVVQLLPAARNGR